MTTMTDHFGPPHDNLNAFARPWGGGAKWGGDCSSPSGDLQGADDIGAWTVTGGGTGYSDTYEVPSNGDVYTQPYYGGIMGPTADCMMGASATTTTTAAAASLPISHHREDERPLCKYFVAGFCSRGKECPFYHDLTVEAPRGADASNGFYLVANVQNAKENVPTPIATPTSYVDDSTVDYSQKSWGTEGYFLSTGRSSGGPAAGMQSYPGGTAAETEDANTDDGCCPAEARDDSRLIHEDVLQQLHIDDDGSPSPSSRPRPSAQFTTYDIPPQPFPSLRPHAVNDYVTPLPAEYDGQSSMSSATSGSQLAAPSPVAAAAPNAATSSTYAEYYLSRNGFDPHMAAPAAPRSAFSQFNSYQHRRQQALRPPLATSAFPALPTSSALPPEPSLRPLPHNVDLSVTAQPYKPTSGPIPQTPSGGQSLPSTAMSIPTTAEMHRRLRNSTA